MTKLEDRLRRDLPDLADALIDLYRQNESTAAQSGISEITHVRHSDQGQPEVLVESLDREPRSEGARLLVAASVVVVLAVIGLVTTTILRDQGDTTSVVATGVEQRRAALIADPPTTLDEARTRWRSEGPSDYQYRLLVNSTAVLDIEVIGSTVRRLEPPSLPPGLDPPAINERWITTIEQLFTLVEDASPAVVPNFDPELGYPVFFRLDPDAGAPGDELLFRVDSLSSIAEIEAAEQALAAWLPEPGQIPPLLEPAGQVPPENKPYLLHDTGKFVVSLVEDGRDFCMLVGTRDSPSSEFTGSSQFGCVSPIKLYEEGLATGNITRTNAHDPLIFFAVVPGSHYGHEWTPRVTADRGAQMSISGQSLLLIFDDANEPGEARIEINCDCGDLVYEREIE